MIFRRAKKIRREKFFRLNLQSLFNQPICEHTQYPASRDLSYTVTAVIAQWLHQGAPAGVGWLGC